MSKPDDFTHAADEYVLGLLDDEDRRKLESLVENNPDARAAVALSRERFLPLDLSAEKMPVPDNLWQKIDSALGTTDQTLVPTPPAASNDNSASLWKKIAIASLAASVMLAVGLGWSLTRYGEPVVVAILLNEAGEPQAVVEDFSNEHATIRLLADFAVPEGKTMQVWTLPSREMGPVSLGLLDQRRSAELNTPALPRPRSEQLYEITLEQTGGSPTGRPTGPILVKGFARAPR